VTKLEQLSADDARLTGARKKKGPAAPRKEKGLGAASQNIAWQLTKMAAAQPERVALKIPRGRSATSDGSEGRIDYLELTFRELEAEVDGWCARLTGKSGGESWKGVRTLVMLRQGLPLIAAVFALFKLGAVPIVIDPGMGLKNFLRCVVRSRPKALVGIPLAQVVSRVFWRKFRSVRWRVWASSALTGRVSKGAAGLVKKEKAESSPDELAAILFTSGSTGAPKGVCYTHGMFEAQLGLIRAHYGIAAGEVDLPMLPVFALFNPALGMTTIVPEIDPRRPAQVDPAKIVQAILQEGVTNSFGSPTLWLKIKRHCVAHGIQLTSLRRVLCAGAPVPAELWEETWRWLPNGQLHSPYGATEALPICSVSSAEVAELKKEAPQCRGACVGKPLPGITVKILEIVDGPIASLAEARELPRGQVGEIIVGGPNVTQHYDALPEATARAKVEVTDLFIGRSVVAAASEQACDGTGADTPPTNSASGHSGSVCDCAAVPNEKRPRLLHRMGDCGYLDEAGRLWFCGRVAERVQTAGGNTLYTEPCEQVFRAHPQVARCALIGLARGGEQAPAAAQTPALVVQPRSAQMTEAEQAVLARELRQLALAHKHTAQIEHFYFHPDFPVDVRHNAKIHRLTLSRWAATARVFRG